MLKQNVRKTLNIIFIVAFIVMSVASTVDIWLLPGEVSALTIGRICAFIITLSIIGMLFLKDKKP